MFFKKYSQVTLAKMCSVLSILLAMSMYGNVRSYVRTTWPDEFKVMPEKDPYYLCDAIREEQAEERRYGWNYNRRYTCWETGSPIIVLFRIL